MKIVKLFLLLLTATGLMLVSQLSYARHAALLIDADSGNVVYELEANQSWYPASLTKLMTLYMTFSALESGRLRITDHMTVSSHAAHQPTSKLGLRSWDYITVEDAILAVITRSANDAAVVLAERLGGSERQFAIKMTTTAHNMGMYGSHFMNATGLPHDWQTTTAHDMALLAWKIIHNFPQYYSYFGVDSFFYDGRVLRATNKFVTNYPGAEGMKTGYTCGSGYNLVASANQYGKRLIGVVLGGKTSSERYDHMFSMMDVAFADRYDSYHSKNINSMSSRPVGTAPYQLSCGRRPSSHYTARFDDDDDDDRPLRYKKKNPRTPLATAHLSLSAIEHSKPVEKIYTIKDHKISVSVKKASFKEVEVREFDKQRFYTSKKPEKFVVERKTKTVFAPSKTIKKTAPPVLTKTKHPEKAKKPLQIAKAETHSKGYYSPDSKSKKSTSADAKKSKSKGYFKPESLAKAKPEVKSSSKSKKPTKSKSSKR